MQLIRPRAVLFTPDNLTFRSPRVAVSALTSLMKVQLQRPTTRTPLAWDDTTTIQVALVLAIDGVEHRVTGRVRGGIKRDKSGAEITSYHLHYAPTVQFGERAKEFIRTAVKDATGSYRNVPLTRIGETVSRPIEAYLELVASGPAEAVIQLAETQEAPAPVLSRYHNSVAFDAATAAQDVSGDGDLQLSHTSTGSNRAVRACTFIQTNADTTTLTYGGTGMTAEHAQVSVGSGDFGIRAWRLAGQATGAQTVASVGTPGDFIKHALNVISVTGVDQTTPVGTSQTATATTGALSVTVTGLATDGLILDFVGSFTAGSPTAGANQTQRNAQNISSYYMRDSTQSSNDGGVMSWTDGSQDYWGISAVEFKPAATGVTLSSDPGAVMMSGTAAILRPGATVWLRHGK